MFGTPGVALLLIGLLVLFAFMGIAGSDEETEEADEVLLLEAPEADR